MRYIIFKGFHFSLHLPNFFLLEKYGTHIIKKKFEFTDSCFYKFNTVDDHDINKLFGFNIGTTLQPHTNSFRFGWNCEDEDNTISIFKYEYIKCYKLFFVMINICILYIKHYIY